MRVYHYALKDSAVTKKHPAGIPLCAERQRSNKERTRNGDSVMERDSYAVRACGEGT